MIISKFLGQNQTTLHIYWLLKLLEYSTHTAAIMCGKTEVAFLQFHKFSILIKICNMNDTNRIDFLQSH
jgi:hypothetical protein